MGDNKEQQQPSPLANLPLLPCNHGNHHPRRPTDDDPFNGRRGVWIYFCFQCMINSSSVCPNLHQPAGPSLVSDEKKEPEKYSTDDKPTVRVYCKAKTDYSLTIRDGKVILAPFNPLDPHQHWIKDETFGKDVKDEQGFSSFSLVNKATGLAMKHSFGVQYPVPLKEYNPKKLDKSVLWSTGKNLGDGYRAVRAVDNIHLNLDGFFDKDEFGAVVYDGTEIILRGWEHANRQRILRRDMGAVMRVLHQPYFICILVLLFVLWLLYISVFS